jgi:hypothetical protein
MTKGGRRGEIISGLGSPICRVAVAVPWLGAERRTAGQSLRFSRWAKYLLTFAISR